MRESARWAAAPDKGAVGFLRYHWFDIGIVLAAGVGVYLLLAKLGPRLFSGGFAHGLVWASLVPEDYRKWLGRLRRVWRMLAETPKE